MVLYMFRFPTIFLKTLQKKTNKFQYIINIILCLKTYQIKYLNFITIVIILCAFLVYFTEIITLSFSIVVKLVQFFLNLLYL